MQSFAGILEHLQTRLAVAVELAHGEGMCGNGPVHVPSLNLDIPEQAQVAAVAENAVQL